MSRLEQNHGGAPLVFLHSSAAHIDTFDALKAAVAPGLAIRHVVREDLLVAAERAGRLTAALRFDTMDAIRREAERGAEAIVCTCSTLGPAAEEADEAIDTARVMRIDRPMADAAVRLGRRIGVCACLSATVGSARELVEDSARRAGSDVETEVHVFEELWPLFRASRLADYHAGIASRLSGLTGQYDALVLAQASMAPATELIGEQDGRILSSPELGFRAAAQFLN